MRRALIGFVLLIGCPPSDQSCEETGAEGTLQVQARIDQHKKPCAVDADCVLVAVDLGCFKGCPAAVRASEKSLFERELTSLADSVCSGNSCSVTQGCVPSFAQCFNQQCISTAGAVPDAGTTDGGSRDGG